MPLDYSGKRQRIIDLQADIKAWMNERQAAQFDHAHPGRVNEEIARLEARIANDQASIARLKYRLEHWEEIVDDANARIDRLQKELILTKHEEKIEKLLELTQRLNEMEIEDDDEAE